jgi:putative membrane protein
MWEKIALIWRLGWDAHPSLLAIVAAMVVAYIAAAKRAPRTSGEQLRPERAALFGIGILTLLLTLNSPLHHLSDEYLFSAHMAQHLLLTLVVPPLLLLGIPDWMARPLLDRPWLARFGRTKAYLFLCFGIFNLLFTFVHFPVIYDTVFGAELVHRLTHVVLLITALVTWLPIASPLPSVLPRLSQPGQMLYCFVQTLPGQLVGALLTLADQVLYSKYALKTMELEVPPVADQQVGGLLMWVVGGTFWLLILTIVFFQWADREQANAYGGTTTPDHPTGQRA